MAGRFSCSVGQQTVIILFLFWIQARFCLALKKDPRSQFYGHAVIQPSIYTETREKRDLQAIKNSNEEKLTIGFVAFNKNFVVDLQMNTNLMPSHYFEKYHENSSSHVTRLPLKNDPSHCHYQGHMQGIDNSWAAISMCNGISGVIYDGNELHYIHPDKDSVEKNHFVFRASDMKPYNFTCGYKSNDSILHSPDFKELKRSKRSTVLHDPYKSNKESRFVELILVNDNKEFREFNRDKDAVFQRSKEIANIVNGLYSSLNIFIALVGVIVWSDHDEINLSPDGDATLTNFLHYRKKHLAQDHPNDNAQLITAMTLDNGVVGKGLKGPICTYAFSGGISVDHSHIAGLVANTIAHELGHNLGFEHDDSDECICPDEKCIMAPSSSSTSPKSWSSCSKEYLELAYSQGMDYCLKNHPTSVIGPVCGNGFVEDGEECDCGLKEFCENKCCNATSCTLFQNATCAGGACCDVETCQVKKTATLCREAVSECDLPEYCDGVSEFCPTPDTFRQNGEECGDGKAYCFDGQCKSHADQCKLLWGPTGKVSDLRCYEQNYRGNVNGNCGYNRINETHKACRKEDVLCGMLHCTHMDKVKLRFGMESAAILARSYINVKGKHFTCRSAIVDLGLFTADPGLTPNGAKCGEEKACLNQKCVPLKVLKGTECPRRCNDNGVCNNRGNCHCDVGFAPPYCDVPGPGGSIDSGPASDASRKFIVTLYVIFLGFFPLMALSVAALYYYRGHLKAWWSKKVHKANIKSRTSTTGQRKARPSSKFNIDRNSLHTLEISGPIQIPPPATGPVPPQSPRTAMMNKLVPSRPAPPKPSNGIPQWKQAQSIPNTYSPEARPAGAMNFRPNCPPPRPPPPQNNTPCPQHNGVAYAFEDPSNESSYYDDCRAVDYRDSDPAFVDNNNVMCRVHPSVGGSSGKANGEAGHRTSGGAVASLAQKFEMQDCFKQNHSANGSLRPPFKSRPLPARPGDQQV